MDSFAILLFALIIVVYLIPCAPITISENFRGGGGGGHGGGFGGGFGGSRSSFGSGGFGGRPNLSTGSFSGGHGAGMMHPNNAGSLTSGYRNNGRYGQGRGRYWNNYGPYGAGYLGTGWWGPSWGYSGGDDGEFIDEDSVGDVVINDNSNYSNNYYQNDFDSDYVSPLQQHMMTSGNEQEKN